MKYGKMLPDLQALENYRINRAGEVEGIWNPLYDYQNYAAAGQTSLSFFQIPIGQSSKTRKDTNMVSAGQLPKPQEFLVTGIEVMFWPGVVLSVLGAPAAQVFMDDVYDFNKSGYLEFTVASL